MRSAIVHAGTITVGRIAIGGCDRIIVLRPVSERSNAAAILAVGSEREIGYESAAGKQFEPYIGVVDVRVVGVLVDHASEGGELGWRRKAGN